jgi:kynurenine formamidase
MKTKSLVVGYVLALALFLFAHRHPGATQPSTFRAVVDLTYPRDSHGFRAPTDMETRLDAPAAVAAGLWTVDQIPPERLIAPLVVLDVIACVKENPDYRVSVNDIASWERTHGEIPAGSVVMALTGSSQRSGNAYSNLATRWPGYSADAAKFLIEARNAVGLGIDFQSIDSGPSTDLPVYRYALSHSVYVLENVANLDRTPAGGSMVMVAPPKLENRTTAPVRILALAR